MTAPKSTARGVRRAEGGTIKRLAQELKNDRS
jgi:hypothetical protein